jgi:hypothetical protein
MVKQRVVVLDSVRDDCKLSVGAESNWRAVIEVGICQQINRHHSNHLFWWSDDGNPLLWEKAIVSMHTR